MNKKRIFLNMATVVACLSIITVGLGQAHGAQGGSAAAPQGQVGTAFTYQGYLENSGSPANGAFDFQFMLYNALSGGSQVGSTVAKEDISVTDGLFSVALDFGSVYDGTGLWLDTGVRAGSSTGSYTLLSPRSEISPAPYALYALNIPEHNHFGEEWNGSGSVGLNVINSKAGTSENVFSVLGISSAYSGYNIGVYGQSASPDGKGVAGHNYSTSGSAVGVSGGTDSPEGYAGYFVNNATTGGTGILGQGAGVGIYGQGTAATGISFGGYFTSAAPQGYAGYFDNLGNGPALYTRGDAAQDLESNGFVKAAAYVHCAGIESADIHRYFNTISGTVTIYGSISGQMCTVDFGFDLSSRYWSTTTNDWENAAECNLSTVSNHQLVCLAVTQDGYQTSDDIMILIY